MRERIFPIFMGGGAILAEAEHPLASATDHKYYISEDDLIEKIGLDIRQLEEQLHPKNLGDAVKMSAEQVRYVVLAVHSGRCDLYKELFGQRSDISVYENKIKTEFKIKGIR